MDLMGEIGRKAALKAPTASFDLLPRSFWTDFHGQICRITGPEAVFELFSRGARRQELIRSAEEMISVKIQELIDNRMPRRAREPGRTGIFGRFQSIFTSNMAIYRMSWPKRPATLPASTTSKIMLKLSC